MAKVIFGNHSSVLVPRQDRDSIEEDLSFYEEAGEGPNVARVKEALRGEQLK